MKIVLAILSAIMVLFSGGCALILLAGSGYGGAFQSLPGAFIFGGIAALNVLVLISLFGTDKPRRWAFYTLAVLDAIVVAILVLMWSDFGLADNAVNVIGSVLVAAFALKAGLTFLHAYRLRGA